jgi:arylsulfatase A-like enzyme
VTANHGEGLGEQGHWFAHGELVAPAETAVPLLLRVPGREVASREDVASLHDLLPTLLAVAGAPSPGPASLEAPGRNLLASGAEDGTVRSLSRTSKRGSWSVGRS